MKTSLCLIYTLVESKTQAEDLAEKLLAHQLASCINILAQCQSHYSWQDQIQKSTEVPLLIKTPVQSKEPLTQFLLEHHPYDCPAILELSAASLNPNFTLWLSHSQNPS